MQNKILVIMHLVYSRLNPWLANFRGAAVFGDSADDVVSDAIGDFDFELEHHVAVGALESGEMADYLFSDTTGIDVVAGWGRA